MSILGIRRAKLDVLHATDHPSQQGQDEMCCPVCCSQVTGCRLGQGWAFRCAGAYFIMFHYDQLSQQEQADALLPAHVFPVTGFGTLPETGEKVLSTKLVAAKKEIHRVPAASAVVTSPAMSWPMLNGTLPATSLSTFRLSSAGLYVATWSELVVWLQGAYSRWGQDQRLLMQADTASEIDDLTLQHQINVMEHKDFCRLISGETQVKTKHSLGQLFLWYAVYCWAARNQGLLPVHSLRVADNERVESCPLTREEWKKLITAALPNFRIIPTLGRVDPQQDESGSGAPAKLWKSMITSSQQQPAGTDEAARLQEAFDDVLHIPVSAIEVAASSLKQLLSDHRVNSQTLRALDSCRQPQQLHAAVKLVWRKLPSTTQAVVRADVREWVSMCAEAVPSTPTPADRFQFLQKCHAAINEAQAVSDWVTTALDLSTVLPRAVDPSPIAEVQCGRTFKAALIAISKQEDLTREHLRQALKGVQQVLEHAGAAPQPSQSYDWFLTDTATSAAGTAMVSPAAPPAVVERAVTALPTGPSPAKISSATSETSSAPSVTASSPVGAVIQPPVPPDAKALRANNLHRERTVQEYNALVNETMRPLTQFTSNDVAKGFGHVYVSADTFDKYFSTVDSIDIHHPGGWFLRLRGRSNAGELYKTDADFRAERRQQAVGMSKRQEKETGSVVPHTPPPQTPPAAQAQQSGPPAVPVLSQHPYMPWSPVPTPGPYYTSRWPSWEGSQPGYGAPPTPQAFQALQPPALPAPGTPSTTAVPTGALPEPTTWAEYAQAQNAPAEGAWRHGWA